MTLAAHFVGSKGSFTLDARFSFPARGVTALFGPSGCGKTTLLRCIAGLNRLDFGRFEIGGEPWQNERIFLAPHKRALGYVFQDANLFAHLSVRDNLLFGATRAARQNTQADKTQAGPVDFDDLVALLGLGHLLERAPANLSGGERQRVAIGRALLTRPKILLMDEPLSALDHASKNEIMPYLEGLHDTLSIPILYVTHAPEEVARLADHLVVLEQGRVLASGPLTETLARLDLPIRHDDNAGVAIEAVIAERDEHWHLTRAAFAGGSIWVRDPGLAIGHRVRLRVLARDVSLALQQNTNSSIMNSLAATVTDIAANGHPGVRLVRVDVGGTPLVARLTARSAHELDLAPGKAVWAQIKSVAVLG
ncbi:MAG: molybdenum ABC transporter ATP-binding protein [Rhodospirillales bacterium]|nr:molybdenum ABC transporter ATP-binding protein [Rhodospirillales bacterium]